MHVSASHWIAIFTASQWNAIDCHGVLRTVVDYNWLQCILLHHNTTIAHYSASQWIAVDCSGLQCITVDCSAGGLVDWHCSTAGTHPPESLPWITSWPDLRMIAPLFFFLNLQNWPGFPWAKGYKKNNKLLKQLLLKGPRWQCMRDFYMFLFAPFPKSLFFCFMPFPAQSQT